MKKLIFLLLILILASVVVTSALAITPPEQKSKPATPPGLLNKEDREKIEDLKERVATKVAQMRSKIPGVLVGEIKEVTKNSLILTTKRGEEKILIDEETKIFRLTRGGRQILTPGSLSVSERVVVIVTKDNLVDGQTAKFIFVKTHPRNINGVVTDVDLDEATVIVRTKQGEFVVDVETTTKTFTWEKGRGLVKSGFSKISVGDRVHVNGTVKVKGENQISALRILVLPAPTISPPRTATPTPTPIESE